MQPSLYYLDVPISIELSWAFLGVVVCLCGYLWSIFRRVSSPFALYFLTISTIWLGLLWGLGQTSFFLQLDAIPPRFLFVIGPPLLVMLALFLTKKGVIFVDKLPMSALTSIHCVRIFVELLLWRLFLEHQIPQMMTFEGRNWDILAGLTAPLVVWGLQRSIVSRWVVLGWNLLALGLLVTIVGIAFLSAPFPFQQLNFQQPNVGVLKSTFIWLPGFVVPVVLWAHLVVIRRVYATQATETKSDSRSQFHFRLQ